MKSRRLSALAAIAAAAAFCCGAHAVTLPDTFFVAEGGVTVHGTYSLTAGVSWPWAWKRVSHSGEWTGMTEAFISHWTARAVSGRDSFTQIGLVPVVRYRFNHGRSDWFADGGIGISLTDRVYVTRDKQFSTRFNFIDVLGIGRSFGTDRHQELSLRISHVSNAGIKKPNPGENFLQLRYAAQF
jgi:lipid A 3-O-deacylase